VNPFVVLARFVMEFWFDLEPVYVIKLLRRSRVFVAQDVMPDGAYWVVKLAERPTNFELPKSLFEYPLARHRSRIKAMGIAARLESALTDPDLSFNLVEALQAISKKSGAKGQGIV
jgi:hypothetical protein